MTAELPSGRTARHIEVAANIAIVLVSCLLIFVLLKTFASKGSQNSASLKIGQRLDAIAGSDATKAKTLILALSTNCRFGTDSAPFYRKLTMHLAGKPSVGIVAIFPQSKTDAGEYLKQ